MSRRSRRQFLEDSMFASAALAAMSGPRIVGAQEPSASPNERLSVAVVGVNGRGREHLDQFTSRTDTLVTYICDVDSEVGQRKAEQVSERQGAKALFAQDLRQVLDDPSVDIVSIATPNHWHSLAAIWAMQAGKDVYVEKPVSHNVLEGRVCVDVARKTGRICQTGTQSRSNPGMRAAIEFVLSGGIGEVKVARGLCYKSRPSIGPAGSYEVPKSVDYNLWQGPAADAPLTRPRFHYDWHWQFAYGNGDLGNQGIHQMDIARWGLGVNRLSDRVISYGGRFGYVDAGDTANTQVVLHSFGDKTLVFEVRGLPTSDYRGANVGVIFEGSSGYVVLPSYSGGAAFDLEGKQTREFSGGGDHFANFIDAVRSRKQQDLNADILEGHLSSALCHTGNISYRLGDVMSSVDGLSERLEALNSQDDVKATLARTIEHLKENQVDIAQSPFRLGAALEFNPTTESFVGRPDADLMLTREYRAPFVVPSRSQV